MFSISRLSNIILGTSQIFQRSYSHTSRDKQNPRNTSLLFLLVLILCFLTLHCDALKVKKTVRLRTYLREIEEFGFNPGGEVRVRSLKVEPPLMEPLLKFYVCTRGEFETLARGDGDSRAFALCSMQKINCELVANVTDPILDSYKVKERNLYHLLISNCGIPQEVSVHIDYELVNPNGQQLSVGYEPLPPLYISLTALWATILIGWGVLCFWHRTTRVTLHTLLTFVSFLKLCVVLVAFIYWKICEDSGRCFVEVKYLQSFLFAMSETTFFCALLLIAKGWKITRARMRATELRTISVALILLLSTLLFFSFYNDGYYFLSLMIMYFFMLPKIFTSITRNSRSLETQLVILSQTPLEEEILAVNEKLKLFKRLRTLVVAYIGCILLVNSMRIVMVWNLEWLNYIMNEVVVLIMLCLISYALLPSNLPLFRNLQMDSDMITLLTLDGDNLGASSDISFLMFDGSNSDTIDHIMIEYPYNSNIVKSSPNELPLAIAVYEMEADENEKNDEVS